MELVTILVTTYNSEQYILETLESVKKQSYEELELIVSDDASTDRTVELVEQWLEKNQQRFRRSIVLIADRNYGISKNFNRGMSETNGSWAGVIAGDDILLPNYVRINMQYIMKNNINSVVFSNPVPFKINDFNQKELLPIDYEEHNYAKKVMRKSTKEQYQMLLKRDFLCSPTFFVNKECFDSVGGCDTRIRNIDDWPLKLKISKAGYRICYVDEDTVLYRIGDSVSHSSEYFVKEKHLEEEKKMKELYCYPNISKKHILYYFQESMMKLKYYIIINICSNKRSVVTEVVNGIFNLFMFSKWGKIPYRIKELLGAFL